MNGMEGVYKLEHKWGSDRFCAALNLVTPFILKQEFGKGLYPVDDLIKLGKQNPDALEVIGQFLLSKEKE